MEVEMRMMPLLALIGLLGVSGPAFGEEPSLRFSADRYPQMAASIDLFEARLNAEDPAIRRRALMELTYFRAIPSKEYVRLLRALMKDVDPVVAGNAIKTLHGLWEPIDPDELPKRFSGYHNEHWARMTLHGLTGQYFQTPAAAHAWYENRQR